MNTRDFVEAVAVALDNELIFGDASAAIWIARPIAPEEPMLIIIRDGDGATWTLTAGRLT